MLGSGRRTERRHEPITQALLRRDGDAFRHLPPGARDADVEQLADAAFAPVRRRRLVVKEVLPLLGTWLADRYDPLLVDLERHPVAIATSHLRLGWDPAERERDRLPDGAGAQLLRELWDELAPVERKVAYVGAVRDHVRTTWGRDAVHVRYEELHADPGPRYGVLAERLGLGELELDVRDEAPAEGPYALTRRAVAYPPAAATPGLRQLWARFATGSYTDDADWADEEQP